MGHAALIFGAILLLLAVYTVYLCRCDFREADYFNKLDDRYDE